MGPLVVRFLLCVGFVLLLLATPLRKLLLRYNLRSLAVRWPVSLLTALAFVVVIALLVVMLAFVNGMYRLTEGSGHPGNVIVLADGADDEVVSFLSPRDTADIERQRVTEAFRDEQGQSRERGLAAVEQVPMGSEARYLCSRETYLVINQAFPAAPGQPPRQRFVQVRGIIDPAIAARIHGRELQEGTWFSDTGVQRLGSPSTLGAVPVQAFQAVVGEALARELGHDQNKERLAVNDVFELGDRPWVIVGVMKSTGSTFDSEVWAKHGVVASLFRRGTYSCVVLRTSDAESAQVLATHLTKHFKPAVLALPERVYYSKLAETNQQFLVATVLVAAIMAAGGVFAVMNTMFAAIRQRTRDIGLLRMMGFARWEILAAFFLESLLIALVGGLLGCALGYLANGWTAASVLSSGDGGGKTVMLELVVDRNVLATGLAFTLAVGSLGGLLPAIAAMRLRPLAALR
jgi:ABC-type lipoprotein release transport system permease subunit